MKPLADFLFKILFRHVAMRRKPDFVVGDLKDPYLLRWWLIPRNRVFNAYLHCFMRSDDDRALHDHPWASLSLALQGECTEHYSVTGIPGATVTQAITTGRWRYRAATFAHRIEVPFGQHCWTLFLTGPVIREWGFHCPNGWISWQRFTAPADKGQIGAGCEG